MGESGYLEGSHSYEEHQSYLSSWVFEDLGNLPWDAMYQKSGQFAHKTSRHQNLHSLADYPFRNRENFTSRIADPSYLSYRWPEQEPLAPKHGETYSNTHEIVRFAGGIGSIRGGASSNLSRPSDGGGTWSSIFQPDGQASLLLSERSPAAGGSNENERTTDFGLDTSTSPKATDSIILGRVLADHSPHVPVAISGPALYNQQESCARRQKRRNMDHAAYRVARSHGACASCRKRHIKCSHVLAGSDAELFEHSGTDGGSHIEHVKNPIPQAPSAYFVDTTNQSRLYTTTQHPAPQTEVDTAMKGEMQGWSRISRPADASLKIQTDSSVSTSSIFSKPECKALSSLTSKTSTSVDGSLSAFHDPRIQDFLSESTQGTLLRIGDRIRLLPSISIGEVLHRVVGSARSQHFRAEIIQFLEVRNLRSSPSNWRSCPGHGESQSHSNSASGSQTSSSQKGSQARGNRRRASRRSANRNNDEKDQEDRESEPERGPKQTAPKLDKNTPRYHCPFCVLLRTLFYSTPACHDWACTSPIYGYLLKSHIDDTHSQLTQCQTCKEKWTDAERQRMRQGELSIITNHRCDPHKICPNCKRRWTKRERDGIASGRIEIIGNHRCDPQQVSRSKVHPPILTLDQERRMLAGAGQWPLGEGPKRDDYDKRFLAIYKALFHPFSDTLEDQPTFIRHDGPTGILIRMEIHGPPIQIMFRSNDTWLQNDAELPQDQCQDSQLAQDSSQARLTVNDPTNYSHDVPCNPFSSENYVAVRGLAGNMIPTISDSRTGDSDYFAHSGHHCIDLGNTCGDPMEFAAYHQQYYPNYSSRNQTSNWQASNLGAHDQDFLDGSYSGLYPSQSQPDHLQTIGIQDVAAGFHGDSMTLHPPRWSDTGHALPVVGCTETLQNGMQAGEIQLDSQPVSQQKDFQYEQAPNQSSRPSQQDWLMHGGLESSFTGQLTRNQTDCKLDLFAQPTSEACKDFLREGKVMEPTQGDDWLRIVDQDLRDDGYRGFLNYYQ